MVKMWNILQLAVILWIGLTIVPSAPFSGLLSPVEGAVPPLTINRIEIFYHNHRPSITVEQKTPGLKANVLISYTGSGLLQGRWQVDGRVIGFVSQHLLSGQTVSLQSPDIPGLPTIDPGNHRVQFVITNPPVSIPSPTALYFVTAGEFVGSQKLALAEPANRAVLNFGSFTCQWEPLSGADLYLIEFYEKQKAPSSRPIYSAYSRKASFILTETVITKFYKPGPTYFWKVKALDRRNKLIGESDLRSLRFKK